MVWKVLTSTLEKFGRFKIVKEQVKLPDDKEITFSYIDFAKGVCVLPITDDGHVLCLRQYRHAVNSWQWEIPAGMIDVEDASPLDTAKRELEEETGYLAQTWTSLGSFHPSAGSTSEEIFLFAASDLVESKQALESSEQIDVHKVSIEELLDLVAKGEFQHGGGLAAVLRYLVKSGKFR
ncbi:NUDIX hydrolase [Fredinandcohnia sp. 179-A 10B2 NHS]|uniref:NUDIX hydrolase n=1 Tax=Fredinandcohnia sp. 179-A 10B2 NHS TaxID=3235176 RepID=UPI0039A11C68